MKSFRLCRAIGEPGPRQPQFGEPPRGRCWLADTPHATFSQTRRIKTQAERLLEILKENPFGNPPPYEKLLGDLSGAYSRRINIQHKLVYQVLEENSTVKVIRMWTHYE